MSVSRRYSPNLTKNHENGYSYFNCNCCPYGYHIDLDFVRYCESIGEAAERNGSIKRRKDRRRQMKSMEVLLGITSPLLTTEENLKLNGRQEAPKLVKTTNFSLFHDGFNDAVSDFERTLQRSKTRLSNNLPDVTAVSGPGSNMLVLETTVDGRSANQEFDGINIESGGFTSPTLQNIREQMALSLERTKHLENQVKLIPGLQAELTTLKEENSRLIAKLKTEETNKINAHTINCTSAYLSNRSTSHPFTYIDQPEHCENDIKGPSYATPRKDMGVMCGVLTRNIGVGHQTPRTRSVSTSTLNEQLKNELNINSREITEKVSKALQTTFKTDRRETAVQTFTNEQKHKFSQAAFESPKPKTRNASVQSIPKSFVDFSMQKVVECYSVGCSEDTINDITCDKCNNLRNALAINPDTRILPINLSSLTMARSKSFNLGDDQLKPHKNRTIACQYELNSISRANQTEENKVTFSKYCQCEVKCCEKTTQYERNALSDKLTDTKGLIQTKNVGCEMKKTSILETREIGCNTHKTIKMELECNKCLEKESVDSEMKKDENASMSRIPRPQIPTTPVEARKFRRQDTYTKIYTPEQKSPVFSERKLSGLDLTSKSVSNETINPLVKVKENINLPDVPISTTPPRNEVNLSAMTKVHVQEPKCTVSETALYQSVAQNPKRSKTIPSKEMQGAMKVLNDTLQINPSKMVTNTSAINIVQKEWFKISSTVAANPLDVEDYLDAFEEMSSLLLQYIVNMSDSSGNTAMHYAVSHGNFDVVSILLDSKVCDINKPNLAGYTSVMLVSLAEVRSKTHGNVVRRLFQLADVNIRAMQHGQTALMLAVSHGRLDMVVMLLEAGADINIQDEDGSTALMCAAEHGHIEIIKHFLNQPDCDSSITDVDGSTALKIAMEAGHKHIGVLLYAHERNHQKVHGTKLKKTKSISPKTPSSPLPIRSSPRALTDVKHSK